MPIRDEYIGDYDVGAAFKRIEDELIDSMMRNLARHNAEEAELGFDWAQWQAEQMEALERYRRQNEKLFPKRFDEINRKMEKAIMKAAETGKNDEEINILQTLRRNKKLRDRVGSEGNIQNGFFVADNRKLDALINATTNDMQRAEYAVLRRCNDQYRKIIFDAQVYYDTGASTFEKALDMATHDFLARGIDSVEYKNGARHTISDYADMVLKTTETRAYLTGQGQVREAWGEHLVVVAKRQGDICCPKCLPWVGRVLVDDVYSGGKPDGKHKTLSEAMAAGFLHPRCRDIFTTYFPGISTAPDPITKEEAQEAVEIDKEEAKEQYAERQVEKYGRLEKYALSGYKKQEYESRVGQWKMIANAYESGPVMSGLNNPGIVNADEIVEEFIKRLDLPDDQSVIACIKKSAKHMPKEDLEMIAEHGLIIEKTNGASKFIGTHKVKNKAGKLCYKIQINPDTSESFVFAHECAHFAEKINDLYQDPEFRVVLKNLEENIKGATIGVVDDEFFVVAESDLFVEPYQGRTYIRDLGINGPEKELAVDDLVEYISDGYECFIGDPKLLESKDPMLYNYFIRRGIR